MKTAGTTRTLLISSALLAATASSGAVRSVTDVEVRDRANATASLAASGRFAGVAWGASTKDNVTDI